MVIQFNEELSKKDFSDLVKFIKSNNITKDDFDRALKLIDNNPFDKLDSRFEEHLPPTNHQAPYDTTKLPDGSYQREYFVEPESGEYYVFGIAGDYDDEYSDSIYLYLYDTEDRFREFDKEFDYYSEADKAVRIANKLLDEISPDMSYKDVESIGKKYLN